MQQLEEPRLITEQEDVHLIDSFLISTKPNEAGWQLSKDAKTNIQDWVGRDFAIIPERIFAPLDEGQGGHYDREDTTWEEDIAELQNHSHGKITKVKGPYSYNDGTDDYYYKVNIKLKDTLSATALIENGSKTLRPFSVSPTILREEGPRENVTKYKPIGLFLVIQGAYGEQAVIEKMCSGSELKCGTKLSAAIHNLNHDTNDAHLAEVLTSYIAATTNKDIMSTQTPEVVQTPVPHYEKPIQVVQQPVNQPVELNKEEKITLTKEEYDKLNEKITEEQNSKETIAQLIKERNESILNQVFGSIEDQEVKNKVLERYADIKDAKIVKQIYDDINTHILPKAIEAKLAESKEGKKESASILKPEPKIVKNETLSASIETDDLSISECRSILGL